MVEKRHSEASTEGCYNSDNTFLRKLFSGSAGLLNPTTSECMPFLFSKYFSLYTQDMGLFVGSNLSFFLLRVLLGQGIELRG